MTFTTFPRQKRPQPKPRLPDNLAACYEEIVQQTNRANAAERLNDEIREELVARLAGIEKRLVVMDAKLALRAPTAPTRFFPGKYATRRRITS